MIREEEYIIREYKVTKGLAGCDLSLYVTGRLLTSISQRFVERLCLTRQLLVDY